LLQLPAWYTLHPHRALACLYERIDRLWVRLVLSPGL